MKLRKYSFLLLFPFMLMAADDIRPYLNTGPWYPSDPVQLNQMLDGFFRAAAQPQKPAAVRGIIAPHAGFQYSGRCAARAYGSLSPAQGIRRVILLGSSHRSGFYGACLADYKSYATPLGLVAVDTEICRVLAAKKFFNKNRDTMRLEHSLENQLPFLQKALEGSDYRIVPIIFGALKKKDFAVMAAAIAPFIDAKTLVIASSDLTHYGENFSYTPFRSDLAENLTRLDQGFIEPILRLDFDRYFDYHEKTGITVCGFVPIGVLIRLFEKKNFRSSLADYYKSGDLNGDYSSSVSYASLVFSTADNAAPDPIGLKRTEQKLLLELARSTLQSYFKNIQVPPQKENQFSTLPNLSKNLGVFVTLRKKGALRGCIGSIIGREPLYRGVEANAVHAAIDDPRFPPLKEKELASVEIELSVMTPLLLVQDYRSIRLGTDGVVIRDGRAQAVFLPQVAKETGWTLEQFLANLCLKAGLDRDAYRRSPTMQFHVFQAQVFSERDSQK
ncbi:MAG: AmmeMemoRadiSam system protein B [Candidatus Aminicenantes bacterium]|nr:AmmeMemoRadiSam system protein B [Candidatus Aminicenantes bacterium]